MNIEWKIELFPELLKKLYRVIFNFRYTIESNYFTIIALPEDMESNKAIFYKTINNILEKMPYTHYFSFEINDIKPAFIEFTKTIPDNLKQYLTKPEHLHITLFLVKLYSPLQVTEIINYMKSIEFDNNLKIDIKNIGGFKNRVAYFEHTFSEAMANIRNMLLVHCKQDINQLFTPHITILNSKFGNKKEFNATDLDTNYNLGTFTIKSCNFVARFPRNYILYSKK